MDKQSNLKVWPVWFPKCLPTVSCPSIVPCLHMGQSHHHLRPPMNLAQGHFWGTLGEKSADAIWWIAGWVGTQNVESIRCGHLGFWLNLWLRNTSGEIYFDLLEAASGTAVAVTYIYTIYTYKYRYAVRINGWQSYKTGDSLGCTKSW